MNLASPKRHFSMLKHTLVVRPLAATVRTLLQLAATVQISLQLAATVRTSLQLAATVRTSCTCLQLCATHYKLAATMPATHYKLAATMPATHYKLAATMPSEGRHIFGIRHHVLEHVLFTDAHPRQVDYRLVAAAGTLRALVVILQSQLYRRLIRKIVQRADF